MSAGARPVRSRRGRVLIVSDVPGADQLARQFRNPPVMVRTLFDAIGEVTNASSSEPISAVVLSDRSLEGRGVEALRKLDPSVQLVLVANDGLSAARIADSGVDEYLSAPLRPEDVARVFAGELNDGRRASNPPSPAVIEPPQALEPVDLIEEESAEEPPMIEPPQSAVSERSILDAAKLHPMDAIEPEEPVAESSAIPQPAGVPQASDAPATFLGDTDLVEAVLLGQGVGDLALKVLVQQTGWHDVRISDLQPRSSADANGSHVEILFSGSGYGWLTSTVLSEAQLVPWADWLGRWLALDRAYQQYRTLTYKDNLTEAWNRRYFDEFLSHTLAEAGAARRPVTLMVFDIDDFKRYNDEFGHEAGDQILCETVRLLTSVIRHGDRVCRIGGDEFAVIFADAEGPRRPGSSHPESVESIAKRFQDRVCAMQFPKLGKEAPGTLSISAGLATFPWDGHDAASLLRRADQRALESKRRGKNAITFGPGANCKPSATSPTAEG